MKRTYLMSSGWFDRAPASDGVAGFIERPEKPMAVPWGPWMVLLAGMPAHREKESGSTVAVVAIPSPVLVSRAMA